MATILIVDDHVLNREFLATLLGYGGHRLIQAADGVEGIKITRTERPHLIISDILMPHMDGYEFVTQIRADAAIAEIPIIFYTAAYCEREAMSMARDCGVRWVLLKPADPEAILKAVHEALGIPQPGYAAPRAAPEGTHLAALDQQLNEYLVELGSSHDLMTKIVGADPGAAAKQNDLQDVSARLSKSLSSLQAVSLRLTALIELGLELAGERDCEQLLETGCQVAHNICVAKYAVVGILDDTGEKLRHFVTRGMSDAVSMTLSSDLPDAAMIRSLMEERGSRRIVNCAHSPRAIGLPLSHPPVRSFLGVAIGSRDRVHGWLYLADKIGAGEFSEVDERSAATVAAQLATAYENLLLYSEIRMREEQLRVEIHERKQYETRLEYLANHDPLTDLANRNLLSDRITQAIFHARRSGEMFALLFIDLDRFKEINDCFGHGFGDSLLKAVAGRLGMLVRRQDTIARHGGDEFIVLMMNLREQSDIVHVVNKIMASFATPFIIEGRSLFMTASIGATVFPEDGQDLQALFKNADTAMYRAKSENGNTFRFYSREMSERAMERNALEAALRHAVDHDEFELFYQPKVHAADGRICGAEALLRWWRPEVGMVSPAQFIPLAEETGLIVPIGEWVFRTACMQNKAWQDAGLPPCCVAINLSARQFRHAELVGAVADALDRSGLQAQYLEMELTESLAMNNAEYFIQKLEELKAMGIRLTIDDFGTGYSSLSYLKRFPIDCLKIDRSFVRDITSDPDDAAIANSVISLGHSLNLVVTAEGVENQEQLTYLRNHHCDEIQGYFFSHPVPADRFASMLKAGRPH